MLTRYGFQIVFDLQIAIENNYTQRRLVLIILSSYIAFSYFKVLSNEGPA
jgi:hypothetical protein